MDRDVAPRFQKAFALRKAVAHAVLKCTALGAYDTYINGQRVGDFILAPGWTVYQKRLQVQKYDVTHLLKESNEWEATVGAGWYASPLGWSRDEGERESVKPKAFIGELIVSYEDGSEERIATDESWRVSESCVRFAEIYDGEIYDASFCASDTVPVDILEHTQEVLIPQEGEIVRETERIAAKDVFRTPAGEIVVDFGQEVTGYVEFTVDARQGEEICIVHGEVLDRDGNFYNANYRSAKARICYTCTAGQQTYHPRLTFFGFRYIRLEQWPQAFEEIRREAFTAIVVHSDMKRTGWVRSSHKELNQLVDNIFWSQRGNFLDVPTDCPQRDERLGWTGDAEVFCKAASYNYDVDRFFTKWLHDVSADQFAGGGIPHVIPNVLSGGDFDAGTVAMEQCSAAWGDAAVICPWQIYQTYGDEEILREQFDSMRRWVDYICSVTKDEFLWTGGTHFGDWLGLDAPAGSYKGSTRDDFIASAYYANSVDLLVRTGKILGKDMEAYESLYRNIVKKFRETFPDYRTQTEHVLALWFHLAEKEQETADRLAIMIEKTGNMETGFLGTPYLLHVLSDHGYTELAYSLLLREEYPGWLYSVKKGATTIWEHWDGIMENGEFWSTDMNSFNHYAYGSVIDWLYEKACGIQPLEPGFRKIRIAPMPTKHLDYLEAAIDTRQGRVSSKWERVEDRVRYTIELPVEGEIVLNGKSRIVPAGYYTLWS